MIDLWYKFEFQPGVVNKLSNVPPFHQCDITVKSTNEHIKKFLCRATFDTDVATRETGSLVAEYENRDAGVELSFKLNSLTHLIPLGKGDGFYKISFYAQNDQDVWNEFYIIFSYNGIIMSSDSKFLGTGG